MINLMGSLTNTGYGIVTKYIARTLIKNNIGVIIHPVRNQGQDCNDLLPHCNRGTEIPHNFDGKAPCLNIWHQHDLIHRIGTGPYAALSFFELNKFKQIEKIHMGVPDFLFAPSKWAASVIEGEIGRKSTVVPMGVDTSIFYPAETKSSGPYTFFNIGKWEKRKGHDLIPRLFDRAFTPNDDVRLVMMTSNIFLNQQQEMEWQRLYKNIRLKDRVEFAGMVNNHAEVADRIRGWDCGLFPSRAEGWNMELLESMACGKPVITTNYSAHTEYCTKDNAYLVDIDDLETAHDGFWFFGHGEWADISYDQEDALIEYMRYCYKERPENKTGIETAKKMPWESTVNQMREEWYIF